MKRRFWVVLLMGLLSLAWVHVAKAEAIRVGMSTQSGDAAVKAESAHEALLMASLSEISKYTNWQYEIVKDQPERLLQMLASGEIDIFAGLYHNDKTADMALFPAYVTGYTYAALVVDAENETIKPNDFRTMQNARIAVVAYAGETKRLLGYLVLNDLQCSIVYAADEAACVDMLAAGQVDMALLSNHAEDMRVISRFIVEPYYLAVSVHAQAILSAVDSAYYSILNANPLFVDALSDAYLGDISRQEIRLTQGELLYAQKAPPLRVAVADDLPPLQSYLPDGGAQGINVDILSYIAQATGLDIQPVRAANIPQAYEMVQNGGADAVLYLPADDDTEAAASLVHSATYLDTYRVALCNKYVPYSSENMTMALMPGMEFLIDDYTGNVVYADTFAQCVALINAGQADYTYCPSYFVEYGSQHYTYHNIKTVTLPGADDRLAIGLKRPVDAQLLTILNKAINGISKETMQDIVLKNTALVQQPMGLRAMIYANPWAVIMVLIAFIGLILLAAVVFTVVRARHTKALYQTQYTDDVTGALNLAGFRKQAKRLLESPNRYALSYATIRNFQYINDRYGYEDGDNVLQAVADHYRAELKEGEIFCRISGGAFAALRKYTKLDQVLQRLDLFHEELRKITPRGNPDYHIHMTAGVYLEGEKKQNMDILSMVDRANATQQKIRESSEVSYELYDDSIFDTLIHAQQIESRMETALATGAFLVYLQPKYSLKDMKPVAAEALVRWMDEDRLVPPDEFIPLFERNGFIAQLDRFIFEQCCRTLRRWLDEGKIVLPLSINVSRVQLYARDFIEQYVAIKGKYQIPDGLLELEFTESILFEDVDRLTDIVRQLHTHGFACSIDDFGKGYSSLTILKNVPVDTMKLDAQFFNTGIDEKRDLIVVESALHIAKSLDMVSVAEGIETKEQVEVLSQLGCDMVQGYVFSRPLSVDHFEEYIHRKLVEGEDPYISS